MDSVFVREMLGRYRLEENLREAEQSRLIRQAEAAKPRTTVWRTISRVVGIASSPEAGEVAASPSRSRGRIAGHATGAGKVSGL